MTSQTHLKKIHPTALIDPSVELGVDVSIGPYALIGPNVTLGDRVQVGHGTTIERNTRVGADTRIWPQAVLGSDPQDLKYAAEESYLEIGARCMIREFASLHRGTTGGGMLTAIGDDVLIMNGVHVGHDVQVGNKCIIAAHSGLGGHVLIGEHAIVGGITAVHQWVRIGAHAMVGMSVPVAHDVPPYALIKGADENLVGVNLIGLKRRGFSREAQRDIVAVMKALFLQRKAATLTQALAQARQVYAGNSAVEVIFDFIDGAQEKNRQRGFASSK